MAFEVLMPKLSSTMTDGTITTWLKEEGDAVAVGEAIFEVMTDKIAIEVEAYEEGVLLKKYIGDGESAPVNSVIGYIGESGEEVPAEMPAAEEKTADSADAEPELPLQSIPAEASAHPVSETADPEKIRATPSARRIAREKGVSLSDVKGSGPNGRIHALDVKNFVKEGKTSAVSTVLQAEKIIPWTGMRKAIADAMTCSRSAIPHVTMNAEVDLTGVTQLREELLPMIEKQMNLRLSYLEIISKAAMIALQEFPVFNAHALEDGIHVYPEINLGLAVAVEDGLLVPVIKNAGQMGLGLLTKSAKHLIQKAREGKLEAEEMRGGTFTISSIGQTKVHTFDPVINAPEAAILGIGGAMEKWTVIEEEGKQAFKKITVLNLCLSFDHRVADGAPAAAFLSRIVELLENPFSMLL